ncbi:MAG: hypothetical protein U1A07_12180, partial [Phenylobacterium sp.]|nr:hypothetical protein [Phenylobacterium sp.]
MGLRSVGVLGGVIVLSVSACATPLPPLPTDPAQRCEALGGLVLEGPPIQTSDSKVERGQF